MPHQPKLILTLKEYENFEKLVRESLVEPFSINAALAFLTNIRSEKNLQNAIPDQELQNIIVNEQTEQMEVDDQAERNK
jgi:hypothetical protein